MEDRNTGADRLARLYLALSMPLSVPLFTPADRGILHTSHSMFHPTHVAACTLPPFEFPFCFPPDAEVRVLPPGFSTWRPSWSVKIYFRCHRFNQFSMYTFVNVETKHRTRYSTFGSFQLERFDTTKSILKTTGNVI